MALAVGRALEPHLQARPLGAGERAPPSDPKAVWSRLPVSLLAPRRAKARKGGSSSIRLINEQAAARRIVRVGVKARLPLPRFHPGRARAHPSFSAKPGREGQGWVLSAARVPGRPGAGRGDCGAPLRSLPEGERRGALDALRQARAAEKPAPRSPPNGMSARMSRWAWAKRGEGAARRPRSLPMSVNR